MARVLLLACCLLALPAPARGEEAPLPSPAAIDAAIERGVDWILAEARGPGNHGDAGKTALAAFTLHHCGLREDQRDPRARRLARTMRWLDRHGPGRRTRIDPKAQTYTLALELMLLRLRDRPEDRLRMARLTKALCRRQARNGQWWYDGKGAPDIDVGDNSNTQFALLALGHAQAAGFAVPEATWTRARTWWSGAAGTQGGFGYASGGSPRSAPTGSMTAAGIASLALIDAALEDEDARADAVASRAVAFLADVFSVRHNHGPAPDRRRQARRATGRGWLHYYLWSVERAMVLAGHERLGAHDWYAAGAARLLATQHDDGSWRQEHPLYATCFALLFLTRAADPPRVFTPSAGRLRRPAAPTTGEAPSAPPPAEPGAVPAPEALPAGDPSTWVRTALPPGELARRCRRVGPRCLRVLVAALDDPDAAVRRHAWEALRALLPPARIARADRHPLARGRLALWVRLHHPDLALREGRFVEP